MRMNDRFVSGNDELCAGGQTALKAFGLGVFAEPGPGLIHKRQYQCPSMALMVHLSCQTPNTVAAVYDRCNLAISSASAGGKSNWPRS